MKIINISILFFFLITKLTFSQNLEYKVDTQKTNSFKELQQNSKVVITDIDNSALRAKMQDNASKLLYELNIAFYEKRIPKLSDTIVSQETLKSILSLWGTSMFHCCEADIIEKGLKWKDGYEVRNIPLFFKEADSTNKYQEATIIFNSAGIIIGFKMSIDPNQYNELLREGNSIDDIKRRQIIINFIENYLTAYNRRDIDFINDVYNEIGVIITKTGVKKTQMNDTLTKEKQENNLMQPKIAYITDLRKVIKNNTYFNIAFDEIEITQHRKYPEIYGVTLKQDWYTSRYKDVGYLFLIIDFHNEENPTIFFQSWQPEKVNNEVLKKEEIYNLGMFYFGR